MENNEKNVQNQGKKESKGLVVGLIVIMLIAVSTIGVGGGYWLSKNGNLFNNNETKSSTDDENKNDKKVIKVVSSQKGENQMVIEGKDSNNNTVWTYTTPIENVPQEVINRGQKLIETRKGKVYLCDWGKLYILDEQTGKVLAKNTEHNIGVATVYTFDENDNLYTISYLTSLDKFDTNANLLKTTDSKIWDKGFYWPQNMTLEGNKLSIDYGEEGIVTVNKDTLEIINSKSNNIASNSNYNTAIAEIKKCLKDEKWLKENELKKNEDNSGENLRLLKGQTIMMKRLS
ncbi:MAG: hypothetical protein IKD76_02965 [Clostridia bacterium]|nr:hypothetical protein [Clostridia bacterium]